MDFTARYNKLNKAQKEAVDSIDGPVMVVAGPGTGKTELLSLRVANILKKTDTLPENILCLTFTDSGANAMRQRLTEIIGKEAYKVAIHTFHSFGNEVINQHNEYFYNGATFSPASELNRYEIIKKIFDELEHDNPLAKKMNDEYVFLKDTLKTISDLKRSGFTSDELLKILDENDLTIEKVNQIFMPIFTDKISVKIIPILENALDKIDLYASSFSNIPSLSKIFKDSLKTAIDEAKSETKISTKPITAWRNAWFSKNSKNELVLKSTDRQKKLRIVSFIYDTYLSRMQEAEKYDYDDMILNVIHTINTYTDLKYDLQEKYQYVLVDEF